MRIAIINLTGGGLSGGGLKTMDNLVPRLIRHPHVKEAQVFVPQNVFQSRLFSQQSLYTWPNSDMILGYPTLKQKISKFAPDVIYIPNAAWINFGTIPTVVMVRNMEALTKPFGGNPVHAMIKNLLRRFWAKIACHQATRIIAVSQFVHEYLVKKWNIPSHKVDVIYHGVDHVLSLGSMAKPKVLYDQDTQAFFFTAGSLVSYRGLEDIVRAIAMLKDKSLPYKFIIAGTSPQYMSTYEKKIKYMAERNGVASSIVWLGHLSAEEMAWCYCNCQAFIMTSRLEACPNLVLEALSHGCINISTLHPPMPELFGRSALYYTANRPEQLKKMILDVIGLSSAEKKHMKDTSFAIAKRFSWAITAEKTLECLQHAAAKPL
jgi:glycosyltransferase involved in cell wall biosynthesis